MKQNHIKCPYCGSKAQLRPASVVRPRADPDEMVYVCTRYPACDAYVAAHRTSRLPMGTLADRPLRRMRQEAHVSLGRLWQSGLMTKKEAYRWLQVQLGLPESETHIARFSAFRCRQVITLCDQFTGAQGRAA